MKRETTCPCVRYILSFLRYVMYSVRAHNFRGWTRLKSPVERVAWFPSRGMCPPRDHRNGSLLPI